jgi:hypothetical protein
VIALHQVQLGQTVTNGQLLLALDDTDLALRAVELERDLNESAAAHERNTIAQRELQIKPASAEMVTADDRRERLTRITAIQRQIEKSYASGRDQQAISELEVRRQEIETLRSELELLQATLLADWQKAGRARLRGRTGSLVEQKRLEALQVLSHRNELESGQRPAARPCASPPRMAGQRGGRGRALLPAWRCRPGCQELLKVVAPDGQYERAHLPSRSATWTWCRSARTRAIMELRRIRLHARGLRGRGSVTRISPEAERREAGAAAGYEVEIAVEETPYPLVLGSRVKVIITLGKRPISEVLFRSARSLRGPRAPLDKS